MEIGSLVLQVLKGLQFLHKIPLSHRNIKPQNILISCDGNVRNFNRKFPNRKVKLCNMEFALKLIPEVTEHMHVYAPSVAIPHDIDIWSLGITIIELLEKIPPSLKVLLL